MSKRHNKAKNVSVENFRLILIYYRNILKKSIPKTRNMTQKTTNTKRKTSIVPKA